MAQAGGIYSVLCTFGMWAGLPALAKNDMSGRTRACDVLHAFVAQSAQIDTIQQVFSRSEQDGRDSQMKFVDESRKEILPDGGDAAAKPDVPPARRSSRLVQGGMNTVRDKPKLRAAFHRERCTGVMGQHENGRVIGRLVAPPTLPTVNRPRAADGTKHVPAEDPGPDPVEALRGKIVVNAGLTALIAVHALPGSRMEEPVKQFRTADPERMLKILARSGAVPIDGDRETTDEEP